MSKKQDSIYCTVLQPTSATIDRLTQYYTEDDAFELLQLFKTPVPLSQLTVSNWIESGVSVCVIEYILKHKLFQVNVLLTKWGVLNYHYAEVKCSAVQQDALQRLGDRFTRLPPHLKYLVSYAKVQNNIDLFVFIDDEALSKLSKLIITSELVGDKPTMLDDTTNVIRKLCNWLTLTSHYHKTDIKGRVWNFINKSVSADRPLHQFGLLLEQDEKRILTQALHRIDTCTLQYDDKPIVKNAMVVAFRRNAGHRLHAPYNALMKKELSAVQFEVLAEFINTHRNPVFITRLLTEIKLLPISKTNRRLILKWYKLIYNCPVVPLFNQLLPCDVVLRIPEDVVFRFLSTISDMEIIPGAIDTILRRTIDRFKDTDIPDVNKVITYITYTWQICDIYKLSEKPLQVTDIDYLLDLPCGHLELIYRTLKLNVSYQDTMTRYRFAMTADTNKVKLSQLMNTGVSSDAM